MARSLLFNVLFYVTTTLYVVFGSPLLFGPRRWAMAALANHARFELWLLKTIVGTRLEVRGAEKLPKGACLVASKHQSAWETFALIPLFRDPVFLMKRELFWIPFHGWFSHKFEMIPVDRDKEAGVGPAKVFQLARGNPKGRIGFISAMSQPFCSTCNRLRLTADGVLRSCLFEGGEVAIRDLIRNTPLSDRNNAIAHAMTECVRLKPEVHSNHGNEQMSRIGG